MSQLVGAQIATSGALTAATPGVRIPGRFGKLAKKSDYRTLQFRSYLARELLAAPISIDNIDRAISRTGTSIAQLFPLDGNDSIGDCTICGVAHIETLWEAFLGKVVIPQQPLVEKTYFQLTGGADTGLNELDVLNYWRKNRFNGDNILAYVAVKPSDHNAVKLAIEWFGAVYIGIQCTQELEQQFSDGVPWTPGKLTQDGHCVVVPTYTADDLTCLTWGAGQKMTWQFWDQCCDECYALLPYEAMLKGFNLQWDFAQLNADLRLVTN
jgi:hypothetical protein